MKSRTNRFLLSMIFAALSATVLSGCKQKMSDADKAAADAASAAVPVSVEQVKWKDININFSSVGSITSQQTPVMRSQSAGNVDKLMVKIGDQVTINQPLIALSQDNEAIAYDQANAQHMQANYRYLEATLVAQRKGILAKRGIVSQMEYDEAVTQQKVAETQANVAKYALKQAKLQLDKTVVNSPINGYVQAIPVSIGDKVQPGTALIQLTNPSLLRAILPYSEEKALYFTPGQTVHLTSLANPDQSLNAQVTNITPSIDPKNRAINVIVDFNNTQNWKPGASVRGYVVALQQYKALVVPESSVISRQGGSIVFIVKNNKAIETPIETGYSTNNEVVVLKGLTAGQMVVTDGADNLNNEEAVKIKGQAAPVSPAKTLVKK